ncbi:hypothetical protein [Paenibacillus phocaensis]|uniref:hypothetical protein n=1 Tax=Paenibacillus phocaensis TaxID=1776378 RepID=UPI000839C1F0|nr:hypothetical protein [Paenibacillus phocaensis]
MKTEHSSGSAGARWMMVAALVMLAAGAFYFLGYRPAVETSVNLEADHEEKRLFLQKTQTILDAKRADLAAEGASADNAKREAAVPGEPDREGILLDLEQAAKSSGVRIQEVVFAVPGLGGQAAAVEARLAGDSAPSSSVESPASGQDSPLASQAPMGGSLSGAGNPGLLMEADFSSAGFTATSLRLTLRGTLAEVKNFAAALQHDERLYVVQSFEYGNEEAMDSQAAVFRLVTFHR